MAYAYTRNPASQLVTLNRSNAAYFYATPPNTTAYGVNGLNQATSSAGVTLSWSAQGNLTGDGTRTYAYDAANRLIGTGASVLTYDPVDRLAEMTGTLGARYQYDGAEVVAVYAAGSSTVSNRLIRGPGPDELVVSYAGTTAASPLWTLQDHQSSSIAITDPSGSAPYTLAYDDYGVPRPGNAGRFMYTGQLWMPDYAAYHYKARAYRPDLGRFLQTDPVGYAQGLNLYAYVGNDPVNNTDPTGMCIWGIPCGDAIVGVIHGLGGTVQVTANLDAVPGGYAGPAGAAIPGGVASAGVYVGRGPEGDLRVGASLTGGAALGADVSAGAQVTAYAGDTSNVRGAAHQVQVQGSAGGSVSVTGGTTSQSVVQPGGGVPFVGASVGVAAPGPAVHVAATQTAAGDIRVPMSPTAQAVSAATTAAKNYIRNRITELLQ